MKKILIFGLMALFALPFGASAHHNSVDVDVTNEDCKVTFSTEWATEGHEVDNTVLVVQVDGTDAVYTAGVGETVEISVDEAKTVKYRVWGGGERDYDDPALSDLDALVEYLEEDEENLPTDEEAPGVEWYEVEVDCEPEPTPAPPPAPAPAPTPRTPGQYNYNPLVLGGEYAGKVYCALDKSIRPLGSECPKPFGLSGLGTFSGGAISDPVASIYQQLEILIKILELKIQILELQMP